MVNKSSKKKESGEGNKDGGEDGTGREYFHSVDWDADRAAIFSGYKKHGVLES